MSPVTATTAADFAGPVRDIPRLVDAPGTRLELLVLAARDRYCAGVDLASGALVRVWAERPPNVPLQSHDKAVITLGNRPETVPDPSQPESLPARGAPVATGRARERRTERLLRPLVHPEDVPLLGSHAPAVPFWERRRDHPSIALVEPQGRLVLQRSGAYLACQFGWRETVLVLPCIDRRLAAALGDGTQRMGGNARHYRLLVALQPPVDGHCHKVVEAVLPRT
jgi:hypothetical protein